MITTLLLTFALAQEPAAAPAAEAPVVIEVAAPAAAPAAEATVVAEEPKADAAPSNEVKLPLPEVVPPKTDAEAVAHAEQAFDAIMAGEIGAAIALIAGIVLFLTKKFKKAPPAE